MKDAEPLLRHSRQTLHSRNLILWVIQQQQYFSFSHHQITGNQIGDEGCRAICEVLETNTSLKELDLGVIQQQQHFSFSHLPNHREWNWSWRRESHCWGTQDKHFTHWTQSLCDTTNIINTSHLHIFQITGNEIGVEGCRAIGEALKANTSLTQLDLRLIQQHHHFSFSHLQITDNKIGDEGGKVIAEALKINTSLTKLFLWSDTTTNNNTFHFHNFKSRGMELEMKDVEPLVRHSRQTLHSLNSIFMWYNNKQQHFSFSQFQITDSGIGDEGCRAIGEALKTNTSLTQLNLGLIQQHQHFSFTHLPNHRESNWRWRRESHWWGTQDKHFTH